MTLWMFNSYAQSQGNKRVNSFYGNWSIGAGINSVDDSGTEGKNIFNFEENWNTTFPFTFSIEYFIDNQWGISLVGSTNKYVSGKNIDNTGLIIEGFAADYLAIDMNARFYFGDLFTNYKFDPYVFLGVGHTTIGAYKSDPFEIDIPIDQDVPTIIYDIPIDENGFYDVPEIGRITLNGGAGFNYWFAKKWGINFGFTGKVALPNGEYKKGPNSVSNHAQFTLGIIYFFQNKERSKDEK